MRVWRSSVTDEYYKQPSPSVYEAQAITPGDIASIESITILDEILGRARPQYRLRGICRPIRMDSLTARIDVATALTGQEKVPALIEAEIAAESYTAVDFELWKNVVHVVISDDWVRFERMKRRAEARDPADVDHFRELDRREEELFRLSEAVAFADHTIQNDGTLADLHAAIDRLVSERKLLEPCS